MVKNATRTRYIATQREKVGLTQQELAFAVGRQQSTVSRWERGDVKNMELYSAVALAKVLGVSMNELCAGLGLTEDAPKSATVVAVKRTPGRSAAERRIDAALALYLELVNDGASKVKIDTARGALSGSVRQHLEKGGPATASDVEAFVAQLIASNTKL